MKHLKLIKFAFLALVLANMAVAGYSQYIVFNGGIANDTLQSLANDEGATSKCHSGGIYSTQCSIEAGVQCELGISGGCSVTCGEGAYACCHIRCECIPYN